MASLLYTKNPAPKPIDFTKIALKPPASPTYNFGLPSTPTSIPSVSFKTGGATTTPATMPNQSAVRSAVPMSAPTSTGSADEPAIPSPYAPSAVGRPVLPQVTSNSTPAPNIAHGTSTATPTPILPPSSIQNTAASSASAPTAPAPSMGASAMSGAESAYKRSLEISPDELSTQEDLDKLIESAKKSYQNTKDQAIPMEFITGQLKSIEDRALGLAEPLERKLARLQSARQSSIEASKFALDRADKAAEANKPIEVGAGTSVVKYNPTTGKYESVFSTPEKKTLPASAQEYEYAVANGYKGTYQQYQTDDANRKRSVTNISTGDSSDPTVAAWVGLIQSGQAKITNVPAAIKNSVAQALGESPTSSSARNLAQDALDAILTLEDTGGKGGAIGTNLLLGFGKDIPGSASAGYLAQLDRVKALLTLPNLQYMKGLGAMSDREFNTISSSVAALNPNMSESQYDTELARIKTVMQAAVDKINAVASVDASATPAQMQLPNGTIVTRQADGTYK